MTVHRRKPTNERQKSYEVTRGHLYWLRGMLMAKYRRCISWNEISKWTGIPRNFLDHISRRGIIGREPTVKRLMKLRDQGLMIHLSDFEVQSTPESEQTS